MSLNTDDFRNIWKRLQIARETVEDVGFLIGSSNRDQSARLANIAKAIEAERTVVALKIEQIERESKL